MFTYKPSVHINVYTQQESHEQNANNSKVGKQKSQVKQ